MADPEELIEAVGTTGPVPPIAIAVTGAELAGPEDRDHSGNRPPERIQEDPLLFKIRLARTG